jgi:hypothetical protein
MLSEVKPTQNHFFGNAVNNSKPDRNHSELLYLLLARKKQIVKSS